MPKKPQQYLNDDVVWLVDKWFATHTQLSKENYKLFTLFALEMRERWGRANRKKAINA